MSSLPVRRLLVACALATIAGCGVNHTHYDDQVRVGGQVSGMWDGATIVLRLQGDGVDELLSGVGNAAFTFVHTAAIGSSITVTVEQAPAGHTCAVTGGAVVLPAADYDQVAVTCAGPAVDVALSAPVPWTFDPEITDYAIDTSTLTQTTAVIVTAADATAIQVDGVDVVSGTSGAPVALPFGPTTITIDVTVDAASRQYAITLDRGAVAPEQYVYGKASNTDAGDGFGAAVAIDGDTMVVGAPREDSSAYGINGDQSSDASADSGAAFVFRRHGATWEQEAYLKASNTGAGDQFGAAVAVSGDRILVGAPFENGPANNMTGAGAVYAFERVGGLWTFRGILRATGTAVNDHLGLAVALESDLAVVGRPGQYDSAAGTAIVFRWNGTSWTEGAHLQGSSAASGDGFGVSIALDGAVLVVGAPSLLSGSAYVFRDTGSGFAEEAVLRNGGQTDDGFGNVVALAGNVVAVGAQMDSSSARGVNPSGGTQTAYLSGAVYVYRRSNSAWQQEAFIKSSNSDGNDDFGRSLAMRGTVLAVVARDEDSAAAGIDADQSDNSASSAGAAYLFDYDGQWHQDAYIKASNAEAGDVFGESVAVGLDGIVIGAIHEASSAIGIDGSQADDAAAGAGAVYVLR